jgi:hypothetical protein
MRAGEVRPAATAPSTSSRPAPCRSADVGHAPPAAFGARTRSRLIRRGSASITSNSTPEGCGTTSPRAGTRPVSRKTRPPSVSTSPRHRPPDRSWPSSASNSSSGVRASASHAALPSRLEGARFLGVVFVLDLADDLFDQVLDGHKPVDAAVFVDHQRHVRAVGLHLLSAAPRWASRAAHRAAGAASCAARKPPPAAVIEPVAQRDVLQVDHADRAHRACRHRPAAASAASRNTSRSSAW